MDLLFYFSHLQKFLLSRVALIPLHSSFLFLLTFFSCLSYALFTSNIPFLPSLHPAATIMCFHLLLASCCCSTSSSTSVCVIVPSFPLSDTTYCFFTFAMASEGKVQIMKLIWSTNWKYSWNKNSKPRTQQRQGYKIMCVGLWKPHNPVKTSIISCTWSTCVLLFRGSFFPGWILGFKTFSDGE